MLDKKIFTLFFTMVIYPRTLFTKIEPLIEARECIVITGMQRVGSKLDVSKLASQLGISRDTVYSYLNFLQGTCFIHLLSPFSVNKDRKVSGAKKIYCADNGLLSVIGQATEGALLENAVLLNLRDHHAVHYYQRRSGQEIDFLLPQDSLALEVKNHARPADYERCRKMAEQLGFKHTYMITSSFIDHPGFVPVTEL